MNRKNPCDLIINDNVSDIKNLLCSKCDRIFSRRDVLKNHIKLNKCKPRMNKSVLLEDKQNKEIMEILNNNKLEIENLKKMILDMNNKKEAIKVNTNNIQSHNNNTITTNSNNSINNNIIIQFGSEDISKLKATEIAKIINRGFCSIEESVKQLHFTPLHI
jgi:esterase/lipase